MLGLLVIGMLAGLAGAAVAAWAGFGLTGVLVIYWLAGSLAIVAVVVLRALHVIPVQGRPRPDVSRPEAETRPAGQV